MMPALVPGILLAVTAIGPAFGFLGGAFLLRFYVDLDKIAAGLHFFFFFDAPSTLHRVCVFVPDEVDLDRGDLRWVGAWWLGFLVASCLLFVAALPYFFFPRGMAPEVRRTLPARRGAFCRVTSSFAPSCCRCLRRKSREQTKSVSRTFSRKSAFFTSLKVSVLLPVRLPVGAALV